MLPPTIQKAIDRLDDLIAQAGQLGTTPAPVRGGRRVVSYGPGQAAPPRTTYDRPNDSAVLDLRIKQAVIDIAPNTAYSARLSKCIYTHHFRDVAVALRADLADGYGESIHALAHGEVFTDMLDQARHLLEEGYFVAAAVTAGTVGESHIRRLALKYGIPLQDAKGVNAKASFLNDHLAKANAYDKTHHKLVAAWQSIRNNAAHEGTGAGLSTADVQGLISGLRGFMGDYPA